MKTSNKLLIGFAAALILLPILGMVYISRVNYKVGKTSDIVEHKMEDFSTPTKNMTSLATTSFTSVNVADAHGNMIAVRYVKDDKSGVKIATEYKDLITANVDQHGELQLSVKSDPKRGDRYISIVVYGTNVKEVTVANSAGTYIAATTDSITFNVKRSAMAGVGQGSHINHLTMNAEDVNNITLNDDIKSLGLSLSNTNFRTEGRSYENLVVSTAGNCEVEIRGDHDDQQKPTIKNLVLNTVGKADVRLEQIKVINCSGSFSDETNVQMPAAYLNQMFKK